MCDAETRYKANGGYIHRKIADNDVLISVGDNVANFNGYITLNPVASFLWDALLKPQTVGSLTCLLTEEFDVSDETARNYVKSFLQMLIGNSMVTVYEEN